jgi:rubrerythrin
MSRGPTQDVPINKHDPSAGAWRSSRTDAGAHATSEMERHDEHHSTTGSVQPQPTFCQRCGYVLVGSGMIECPICRHHQCVNCGA